MMESSPASRHHSGSCASPALVMMVAWFFSFFLFLCRLGMNPNPSTPVSFHHACAGGRDGARSSPPRYLLLLCCSRLTMWLGLRRVKTPTTTAVLAAPLSGPLSSSIPPPPLLLVPSGGTRLAAPSSPKDVHR
jgi:hypothetical protein